MTRRSDAMTRRSDAMTRQRIVAGFIACLTWVTGSLALAAAVDEPESVLDRPITLTLASISLDEFADEIAQQVEVPLSVDPDLGEVKVTVRLRERPLRQVFNALREQYGFHVSVRDDAYLVSAGGYPSQLAARQERYVQSMRRRIALLQERLSQHPHLNDPENHALRLFSQLEPEAIEKLFTTYEPISLARYDDLTELEKEEVRKHFEPIRYGNFLKGIPMHKLTEDELRQSTLQFVLDGEGVDMTVSYRYYFPFEYGSGRVILPSQSMIQERKRQRINQTEDPNDSPATIYPKEIDEAELDKTFFETDDAPRLPRQHPLLLKRVSITWDQPEPNYLSNDPPLDYSGTYGDPLTPTDPLFLQLAEQADLDLIADAYTLVQIARLSDVKDQPLAQVMQAIYDRLGFRWSEAHGIHLLRYDDWDTVVKRDLPAPRLRKWLRYFEQREQLAGQPLRLEEVAAFTSDFTPHQHTLLPRYLPYAEKVSVAMDPFLLWGSLDEPGRQRLASEEGYPLDGLDPSLRSRILETTHRDFRKSKEERLFAPGTKLRIRTPAPERIVVELYHNEAWETYREIETSLS